MPCFQVPVIVLFCYRPSFLLMDLIFVLSTGRQASKYSRLICQLWLPLPTAKQLSDKLVEQSIIEISLFKLELDDDDEL